VPAAAAVQARDYIDAGPRGARTVPTQRRVVLERFFDETGGMQLVLHAPFGGRINRAWGLALRKRFCRGFGFELQAAANEDAILLSLSPQHGFDLAEVSTTSTRTPRRRSSSRRSSPRRCSRRAGAGTCSGRCSLSVSGAASAFPRRCCACVPTIS